MIKSIEMMKMVKTILLMSLTAMMSFHVAMAANYTVGGSGGWDQMTDLATWASSQRFEEGDFLLFQYTPNHDVTEVSSANFGPCTDTNPIRRETGGATVVALTSAGSRYFICASHCLAGMKCWRQSNTRSKVPKWVGGDVFNMKVQIDTLAASSPPPSTTPATPSPPPAASPPRNATPSSPPKHSPSPKTSPAPPKKAANNGPTLPPSTAPPPSGSLSPPPPAAPSSAAKFGVKSAVAGFAVMMMLFNL